jgi:hypothetical protein
MRVHRQIATACRWGRLWESRFRHILHKLNQRSAVWRCIVQAALVQIDSQNCHRPDALGRKQNAWRAVQRAVLSTQRYLAKCLQCSRDLAAEAEIAEQWTHAASCLNDIGDYALAQKCFRSARYWQQQNPYL